MVSPNIKKAWYKVPNFFNFDDYFQQVKGGKVNIGDRNYRSIWADEDEPGVIKVIDQERLPFFFEIKELRSVEEMFTAIKDLTVRGAPAIGAAGAYGMYLATLEISSLSNIPDHLNNAARYLSSCRPTAVNLSWATGKVLDRLLQINDPDQLSSAALACANEIAGNEIENCRSIGEHGLKIIEEISARKNGEPVNILTHCNAGWLACIDYGTVTAPIYLAHQKNIPVHVWVDETRPRNQGSRLTAWELGRAGVPCTVITDNAGGHLMQNGMVDVVFVGSDRATRRGDIANKIGTYLKALAARESNIPFYSVLPSSTIDFSLVNGTGEIIVEERDPLEVTEVTGLADGKIISVRICPDDAKAVNFGFDITPAYLITGLITERGICRADEDEIKKMFSDKLLY
jgi:methylthioribose-1-phosphate isomerase